MGKGTSSNPYPSCHFVLFNISDEYWKIIEDEYKKCLSDPKNYVFPHRPFGDSIISKEHEKAIHDMFSDILKK